MILQHCLLEYLDLHLEVDDTVEVAGGDHPQPARPRDLGGEESPSDARHRSREYWQATLDRFGEGGFPRPSLFGRGRHYCWYFLLPPGNLIRDCKVVFRQLGIAGMNADEHNTIAMQQIGGRLLASVRRPYHSPHGSILAGWV